MRTRSVSIPSNETNILFDDSTLLETILGKEALNVSSANTNCDCASYPLTTSYEDRNPDQISSSASQAD